VERRVFLMAAACALTACASGLRGATRPAPALDLREVSLADLRARLARGDLSALAVVEHYQRRIAAVDAAGPRLRAVLELNPDALAIARELDRQGRRGPLHGVPILLKDNMDTADRMATTAGSLALVGSGVERDAPIVTRLRAAGAVVLGKTNMSEWANARDTHSASAWSARGGLTKNPYCLDRSPSGSSSGSAVAVAASLAAAAIGTETNGSIIGPAAQCGIVGLKPTVGLLDAAGIVPISESQDAPGPMTRTVTDAAILLGVMAGADYTSDLTPDGIRGKRIGVLADAPWVTPPVARSFRASLAVLKRLGAELVEGMELPRGPALSAAERIVLLHELKAGLQRYLSTRTGNPPRSLEDVIRFNSAHADTELRWFGQNFFEEAAGTAGLDAPAYHQALAECRRLTRAEGIDDALAKHRLDALTAPANGPAWTADLVAGDNFTGGLSYAAIAGYPCITVPSGDAMGLPLGIQFFGGARQEKRLLLIAYAFERESRARRPPSYRVTLDEAGQSADGVQARGAGSAGSK
jgi:amidase